IDRYRAQLAGGETILDDGGYAETAAELCALRKVEGHRLGRSGARARREVRETQNAAVGRIDRAGVAEGNRLCGTCCLAVHRHVDGPGARGRRLCKEEGGRKRIAQ